VYLGIFHEKLKSLSRVAADVVINLLTIILKVITVISFCYLCFESLVDRVESICGIWLCHFGLNVCSTIIRKLAIGLKESQ